MSLRLASTGLAVLTLVSLAALSGCGGSGSDGTSAGGGKGGAGGEGSPASGSGGDDAASTSTSGSSTHGSSTHAATSTSSTGAGAEGGGGSGGGQPVTASSGDTGGMGTGSTSSTGIGGGFDCAVEGVPGDCMDKTSCTAEADHAATPGFCPGTPANIQCCTPYGKALCDPSIVPHPNAGKTTEKPGVGGCPDGMIPVSDFCIDQFEATLVEVSTGEDWSPFFNPGTTEVRAISVGGVVPQGYIDGDQAGDACTNAGKRLCTDTEWLRACEGPQGTTYPYGNTLELGECNDHRAVHPAVQYFGTSDNSVYSMIDNPCLNQLPESVDLTGSLPGCITAEGAFDMMGNLHEWTADPAGTFRGGYYVDTKINGPGCHYVTTAHNTLHWDYSTGFRCCAD